MATWTTRSHDWQREDWTRQESDYPESRYPDPTPARVAFARGLGVVGILGSLALAAFAFAPRSQELAGKVGAFGSRLVLPWDPKLAPGPAPLPLDSYTPAPSPATHDAAAAAPASNAAPAAAPVEPGPLPTEALSATPLPDATAETAEPVTPPPAEPPPRAAPTPSQSVQQPTVSSEVKAPRARRAPVSRSETPAGFTPEEIQRRKDRYEAWLQEQGLQRIE